VGFWGGGNTFYFRRLGPKSLFTVAGPRIWKNLPSSSGTNTCPRFV